MQQIPTSAGIMVSMASTGAPLFIPMPIQQQAQPGQGRPSAIQVIYSDSMQIVMQ